MSQPIANAVILDIALRLTEQEDQIALRQVLLQGVRAVPHVEKAELFKIKSDLDDQNAGRAYYRNAVEPDTKFEQLEQRQTMLEAIAKQQICKDEVRFGDQKTYRYAIPILSSGVVSEMLSIESEALLPTDFQSIEFLSNIYCNYMQILHKYERDALTGLLNRRSFDDRLNHYMEQLAEAQQQGREEFDPSMESPVPHLAVLDIDHFKRVNDNYGHLYGDDVLLLFSNQMREQFSAETSLYRFGGEEFVVVMHLSPKEAEAQLEQFRTRIEQFEFPQVGQVTVSIGYTAIFSSSVSSEIIDRADQALYYAKEHGRNRVCSHEALVASGEIAPTEQQDGGEIELF